MESADYKLIYFIVCLAYVLVLMVLWLYYYDCNDKDNCQLCMTLGFLTPIAPIILVGAALMGGFVGVLYLLFIYLPQAYSNMVKKRPNQFEQAWKEAMEEDKKITKDAMIRPLEDQDNTHYMCPVKPNPNIIKKIPPTERRRPKPGEQKSFRDTFKTTEDESDNNDNANQA